MSDPCESSGKVQTLADTLEYRPDRWTWKPDARPVRVIVNYDVLGSDDILQALRFLSRFGLRRGSRKALIRWVSQTGWNVWVANRNGQNIVGLLVSRHLNGKNEVLNYGFNPAYTEYFDLPSKLLLYAEYEMPEQETVITVRDSDKQLQDRLKALDYTAVSVADDHESWIFRRPAVLTLGPGRIGRVREASRKTDREPTER